MFAKYLKMRFNSQVLLMIQMGQRDPYMRIKHKIRDIFECCGKSDKLKGFTKLFLVEVLQDGIKTVKRFRTEKPKNYKEFFQSE